MSREQKFKFQIEGFFFMVFNLLWSSIRGRELVIVKFEDILLAHWHEVLVVLRKIII